MKSLECLTAECISLLQNNKLLLPLIKSELIKSLITPISIEEDVHQAMLEKIYKQFGLNNKDDYQEWLKLNKLDEKEFESKNLNNIKLKKYCKENFDHKVESRFLERKN